MNIKLSAWYFLHDKPKFWSDVRRRLHILTLEKSQYYNDCVRFYETLEVKDKIVIDVGCDFGTTPMYFIRKGAIKVIGFSRDKQYFHDYRYKHFNSDLSSVIPSMTEGINVISGLDDRRQFVLKSDCEGCEWDFTRQFVDSFEDWIIAVHTPIRNNELYEYIKTNGVLIGKEEGSEIGVYKKKFNLEHVKFMTMSLKEYKLYTRLVEDMNHINLESTRKMELINDALKATHLNSIDNIKAVNEALNRASKEKSEVNEVND